MIQLTAVIVDCHNCQTMFHPIRVEPENGQINGRINTMLKIECPNCRHISFINISICQAVFEDCACKTNDNKKEMEDFLHDIHLLNPDDSLDPQKE